MTITTEEKWGAVGLIAFLAVGIIPIYITISKIPYASESAIEQIQSANAFYGKGVPSHDEVAGELMELQQKYGESQSEALEILKYAASVQGATWDLQKKITLLVIAHREWQNMCGGKC